MALRLRRGTNAERLLITPLEGELIYATDTKKLYIGDGATTGGNLIESAGAAGGATALDELTDVAVDGAPNQSVLYYNSASARWEPVAVNTLFDVANLTVGQNLRIDIVGQDSTLIVDSNTSSVHLGNNQIGDLDKVIITGTPAQYTPLAWDGANWINTDNVDASIWDDGTKIIDNVARSAKIDMYTDSGQKTIDHNSGNFFYPDGVQMIDGGLKAFAGDVQGTIQGNVVSQDLLVTMVDATAQSITAPGGITGDLKGSVVGDDSTVMVDGVSGTIVGAIVGSTASFSGQVDINATTNIEGNILLGANSAADYTLNVYSTTHGAFGTSIIGVQNIGDTAVANEIGLSKFRGTVNARTAVQSGDSLGGIAWAGAEVDGGSSAVAGAIRAVVTAAPSTNSIEADIQILTRDGGIANYDEALRVRHDKVTAASGAFKLVNYADTTARDAAIPTPEAGMTVFITNVAKFQGYDGSAWVNLN